jgi:hypothetical protein
MVKQRPREEQSKHTTDQRKKGSKQGLPIKKRKKNLIVFTVKHKKSTTEKKERKKERS